MIVYASGNVLLREPEPATCIGDGAKSCTCPLITAGTQVITLSQAFNAVFIGLQSFSANQLTCRLPICLHPQSIWARQDVFPIPFRFSVCYGDLCLSNDCGNCIAGRSNR
jgi:hypothetical protein